MVGESLVTKQGEGALWQWNVAVLHAFATTALELHASAVDPADLEVDALADAQAAGVDGGQASIVGRLVDKGEDVPDLLNTEHNGQSLDLTGSKQVEAGPGALKGNLEEELERSDSDRGRGARKTTDFVEGEKNWRNSSSVTCSGDLPVNSARCWTGRE